MKDGYIKSFEQEKSDMLLINKLSRKEMSTEEVYAFSVVLCDNEIDRDFERFTVASLEKLAKLYIGKTGIFDHSMKGSHQVARVFDTKVEKLDNQVTKAGEAYHRLLAKAYMVRTKENESLIAEIDAGIKKEVSVGCSMGKTSCSVCGSDTKEHGCSHKSGASYDGELCHRILDEPIDAYEWSFVAVPAQVRAGVVKGFKHDSGKEVVMTDILKSMKMAMDEITLTKREQMEICEHISALENDAVLGKKYKNQLQQQLLKMCPSAMPEMDCKIFSELVNVMTEKELQGFKCAFEARLRKSMPISPQLATKEEKITSNNNQFKI